MSFLDVGGDHDCNVCRQQQQQERLTPIPHVPIATGSYLCELEGHLR